MLQIRRRVALALIAPALMALAGAASSVRAQTISNAFVYQGELRTSESAFDGAADIRFALWTASSDGVQVGVTQEALGVDVVEGRFSVMLNPGSEFGAAAFNGQRRWIELSVRAAGSGEAYEVLAPRQEVTVAPYAAFAANAGTLGGLTPAQLRDAGSLTGTLPDAALSSNIPLRTANQTFSGANTFSGTNTFTGPNAFSNAGNTYAGSGAALTALNASNLASGTVPDARLSNSVAIRGANQTFSGSNTFNGANLFNNTNNTFLGNGTGLTGLSASNISMGTLADARLSANVPRLNGWQTFTGINTFTTTNYFTGLASFQDQVAVGFQTGALPSHEFRMHLVGGTGQWKGGIAASGPSNAVVMGELNGRATIGANNADITAWTDLEINPFGGEVSIGGNVRVPSIEFSDASVMTSAPRVVEIFDPTTRNIPAGNGLEFTYTVPGAEPGMGVIVNPAESLEPRDVLAFARVSGVNSVRFRITNVGTTGTTYTNRTWIVTLIPPQ